MIFESSDFSSTNLATLFDKLQEYVIELKKLANGKEHDKNKKTLALKTEKEKDSDSNEKMMLIVQNIIRLMKHIKHQEDRQYNKETSSFTPTCF